MTDSKSVGFETAVLLCLLIGASMMTDQADSSIVYARRVRSARSEETVAIELEVAGKRRVLDLHRTENLISDASIVEFNTAAASQSGSVLLQRSALHFCYFSGTVRGERDDDSCVALSICDGLQGFIYTNGTTYFIEPLRQNSSAKQQHQQTQRIKRSNGDSGSHGFESIPHTLYTRKTAKNNQLVNMPQISASFENLKRAQKNRSKRSESSERFIEALVVADHSMHRNFKEIGEDLVDYLLTVLNMVSAIYRHHSIGVSLEFSLVRMIIFTNETETKFSNNIEEALNNFCAYQQIINHPLGHSQHHDVAILITQLDFSDSEENSTNTETLGLARLGGICDSEACCNVNQNNGLSLAFTIAHELGHNLNADHDADMGCERNESVSIMQTNLRYGSNSFDWSECSRQSIRRFLHEGNGECLDNKPLKNMIVHNITRLFPGTLYDYDVQCKLRYGVNASHCFKDSEMPYECTKLWCRLSDDDDKCHSSTSVAEGTICAVTEETGPMVSEEKWCLDGECVAKNMDVTKLEPVDGGWSEWDTEWSNCSHPCDGGVQYVNRYCNNPIPENGGRFCMGTETRYRTCNFILCKDKVDPFKFHNEMCRALENNSNWQTILKPDEKLKFFYNRYTPCKLLCFTEENNIYIDTLIKLPDGTKCSPFSPDICINGGCRRLGCDLQLESKLAFDKCGVCDGDNSTCAVFSGSMHVNDSSKDMIMKRHLLVKIPKNSVNILIIQDNFLNFIAIKNSSNFYYLNGDSLFKKNIMAYYEGLDFSYDTDKSQESLTIRGPTPTDIIIELVTFNMDSYVRYEYAQLNRTNVTSPAEGLGPGNSELVNEIDVMNIAFNDTVTDGDFAVEVDDEGITAFITFTLRNATYWIVGDWSNTCKDNPCFNETRSVACSNVRLGCDEKTRPVWERECELPKEVVCKAKVASLVDSALEMMRDFVRKTLNL